MNYRCVLNEAIYRYVPDDAIRYDWCEVEPMCFCILSHRISARSKFANFEPPPILTRHRNTAELRVVGIETSCTQSVIEPPPESNDLAMSRLRIRERVISSCVDLAPTSLNVYTRSSQTYMWFYSRVGP